MAETEADGFLDNDHQAAYIFNPDDEPVEAARPSKKRKVSRKSDHGPVKTQKLSEFPRLFEAESPDCIRFRQQLYEKSWAKIDARIQNVLKASNQITLEEVGSFVREAPTETAKIPSAFIITGPNIASQDLLFGQLAESLHDFVEGKFVRMLSAEAPNLKASLKKIIRDVTRRASESEDDVEVAVGQDGRKYLNYDLAALHAFVQTHESKQVIIAFQDTEAFDTNLLTDLIELFQSWQDRIQFTLLFGVATSVELFQARLPKSAAQNLYGSQFDVVQASAVLESIFKCAVAHAEGPLLVGPTLLQSIVDRQQDQVAGIQDFISSLKYTYMCHFYANLLSIFLAPTQEIQGGLIQPEHLEATRNLPSFRSHVEAAVEASSIQHVGSLVTDDEYLTQQVVKQVVLARESTTTLLRSLLYLVASNTLKENFITLYINALRDGIDLRSETTEFLDSLKRITPEEVVSLIQRIIAVTKVGDPVLGIPGWSAEAQPLLDALSIIEQEIGTIKARAGEKGNTLRSKYTAHSKVLRTTVIAQKVQLSQDTAALTDEDTAYTGLIDALVGHLSVAISCKPSDSVFLHEIWRFDFRSPHKDVFTPRPGIGLERALSRPHDYLACACCGQAEGGVASSLPATSILYHLYLETGALVNVADLWTAFYSHVGEDNDGGVDERTALVLFYRALADLRTTGFVKASRKKADHIAKLKWL